MSSELDELSWTTRAKKFLPKLKTVNLSSTTPAFRPPPMEFSLFDLESVQERSIAVAAPVNISHDDRYTNNGYVTFDEVEKISCPPCYHSNTTTPSCPTVRPLPMYYPLDTTHVRLKTTDPILLEAASPLQLVLKAQSLLPSKYNCSNQTIVATKSKIKGILCMGTESVDFRIHCFVDGNDTIIEFHRRSGSAYLWNQYFNLMKSLLDNSSATATHM